MKRQTALQYLSTASDTFLIVAFAVLVSLPFAIGLAVQPVKDNAKQNDLANAQAHVIANLPQSEIKPTTEPIKVLGVSSSPSPLSNVDVTFLTPNDSKKLTLDKAVSSNGEYNLETSIKLAGTYDLLKVTNKNSSSVNLNLSLSFDTKATTYTVNVNKQQFIVNKSDAKAVSVTLDANSDTVVSLTANAKNLGSVKVLAKLD